MQLIQIEQCRRKGHLLYEAENGIAWCRRCHEKTDEGFAADARFQLKKLCNNISSHESGVDMPKKDPEDMKFYPTTYTINLGTIEVSQKRRAAYEKAAAKNKFSSTADWIKALADEAAGFEEGK